MSELKKGTTTSEKSPILAVSIFLLAVVLTRVWIVAEQLRTHCVSTLSTHWIDDRGAEHTITLSTTPGRTFNEFLNECDQALRESQITYPRKQP